MNEKPYTKDKRKLVFTIYGEGIILLVVYYHRDHIDLHSCSIKSICHIIHFNIRI